MRKLRSIVVLLTALALLVASMPTATLAAKGAAAAGGRFTTDGVYIVRMDALPAVVYDGSVKGLRATAPQNGQKIDPYAAAVVRYTDYLKSRHDAALTAVGASSSKKLYSYVFTNDAFAARITAAQANALAARDDVLSVAADAVHGIDTSSTPNFLGLDAAGGLWAQLGGVGSAGEGVIVGIVDSGIWPESLSFADRVDADGEPSNAPGAKRAFQQIPGWHGKCVPGEQFTATDCNQKLIGAQYFNAGQGGNAEIDAVRPWEFNSVRDYNGHGTHTASTSAGNANVQLTGQASVFGEISGMAPRARVAAYKALWSTQDGSTASGTTSDLAAAIDQAVADGVDVINYSVSGTTTNFADAVEISFLFAAAAGVFVATSAGNSGPTASTVAHPSPWLTTVAAGTHNRDGNGSVTLGNGVTYNGKSVATPVGPVGLIDSTAAGMAGADATKVELCYGAGNNAGVPVLDPAKVAGKIVVCKRGVIARVDKSKAVLQAGGVGMIMYNDPDSSRNADFHYVPSVHVDKATGLAVKAYAATAGATATINQSTIVYDAAAPITASFSSRGPLLGAGGDLLKPDVIAPGQDIVAAVSPSIAGRDFDLLSGTSMSSPHVAGLAALLMDLHPDWSPMMVKSALMTTGGDVLDGPNTNPLVIFRQGAGHVRPNTAADPGLVFNSGWNDWLAFLCGQVPGLVNPASCTTLGTLGYSSDASNLNAASIAIGDLAGIQTVKRKITNVGPAGTYSLGWTGLTGIGVTAPASVTLAAGETKTIEITFTRTSAAFGTYVGGQLTLSGPRTVRIPVVIRPVGIAAPGEVTSDGSPVSYSVTPGFTGTLSFDARGLVPATETAGSVSQDPDQTFTQTDSTGTYVKEITVPAGTSLFRVGIDESSITPSGTDLDVFVYVGTTRVAQAADGDSNEMVTLVPPAGGATYKVYVHGFDTVDASANFVLYDWQVQPVNAGNVVLPAPTAVTIATPTTVNLSFSGLDATKWYLGQVLYLEGATLLGSTILSVR